MQNQNTKNAQKHLFATSKIVFMPNRKRKNLETDEENESTEKLKKCTNKLSRRTVELEPEDIELANDLDKYYLNPDHPRTTALKSELAKLYSEHKFMKFMQLTQNKVFNWALTYKNANLFEFFLALPENMLFVILNFNDYGGFKAFLQTNSQATPEDNQFMAIIEGLLKKLPDKWEVHELIEQHVFSSLVEVLKEHKLLRSSHDEGHKFIL